MAETFPTASILAVLFRRKWIILGVAVLSAVGAYLYTRTLPEYFKSTVNCVPAQNDQGALGGAMGGLGSALKDFGLTKLGGKSGEQYEFIVVLFTRSIRDSMIKEFDLVKEYELEGKPMKAVREEFDENLEVDLHAEGNYEISIWSKDPAKAAAMCKRFVSYANQVANRIHRMDAVKTSSYLEQRVLKIDSAMAALTDSLGRYGREYLLFSPLDQAKSSASALAEAKANILKQETLLGLLERSYGADDPQVRAQRSMLTEMETQLQRIQSQPGFAGNFAITDAAGIGARYVKLTAEFEAFAKLKAFLLPTLEQTRLDQMKTTPSLLVVDEPIPAEKKDRPKRALVAAGSGFGAGVLVILILLLIEGWKSVNQRYGKP